MHTCIIALYLQTYTHTHSYTGSTHMYTHSLLVHTCMQWRAEVLGCAGPTIVLENKMSLILPKFLITFFSRLQQISMNETRVTMSDPEFQILELRRRNPRISQCKMLGILRKSRDSRTTCVCQILGMNRS